MYDKSMENDINRNSMKKNNYYDLVNISLFLFVLFAVFMPADNLNLKKGFFAVTFLISFPMIKRQIFKRKYRFLCFMTIGFPIVFMLISVAFFSNNISRVFSIGHCGLYFVLYFAVIDKRIKFSEFLIAILQVESVVIIVSAILHFTGILRVWNNGFLEYMWTTENAMIGIDIKAILGVLFFFKTSPLLVILEGYAAHVKDSKWVVISTIALVCSGTRANTLCALAIFLAYFGLKKEKSSFKYILRYLIIFIGTVLLITVFIPIIVEFMVNLSLAKVDNDAWRSSIMQDVFKQFKERPLSLWFGTGFGSPIYTSMYGEYKYILEVSYLDLLRQVGLIGFVPFCIFIIKPIKEVLKKDRWIILSYVAYLIISATNPLLYSSTGYLAYIFVYLCADRGEIEKIVQRNRREIRFKF